MATTLPNQLRADQIKTSQLAPAIIKSYLKLSHQSKKKTEKKQATWNEEKYEKVARTCRISITKLLP